MARNASGTHSLPSGNPVVAGTAADPVAHNATVNDISAEITDSLSRSGKGGMSAPLVITAGSAAAPSIAPTGDANTGIYAPAANEIAITTDGTQRFKASSAGVNVTGAMAATGAISGTTGTFTGAVAMGTNKITGLGDGSADQDAVTYIQTLKSSTGATTNGAGWTATTTNLTKRGGVVSGTLYTSVTTVGSASWNSIIQLPAGFRPAIDMLVRAYIRDSDAAKSFEAEALIATGGVLSISQYLDAAASWIAIMAIGSGDEVSVSFTFVAA